MYKWYNKKYNIYGIIYNINGIIYKWYNKKIFLLPCHVSNELVIPRETRIEKPIFNRYHSISCLTLPMFNSEKYTQYKRHDMT